MEALFTAVYIVNNFPDTVIRSKSQEEVRSRNHASYWRMRISGCHDYSYTIEDKLDARPRKCTFLGYDDNVKGYRLRCIDKTLVIVSRFISFIEPTMLNRKTQDRSTKR